MPLPSISAYRVSTSTASPRRHRCRKPERLTAMLSHLDKPASVQRRAAWIGGRAGTTPAARACRPARWAVLQCLDDPAMGDRAPLPGWIGALEAPSAPVARGGLRRPLGYPWQ